MRKLITILLFIIPTFSFGQFSVDFQFSNIPFFGVSYEIADKLRPEVRVGTDTFLSDLSLEAIITYDILNKTDYEFYAGVGARTNQYPGLVIPVGFNFYPFEEQKLAFMIELAPIIGESDILRGSVGLRYKFASSAE